MSQRWATGRVEAFSDGVFAIAITLLVLEINVEPADLADPWRAIADEWPAYLAFVTSFLTIGGVWLAHHSLFSRLRSIDPALIRLNMLLLMAVSFLPFPTGLMAEALQESREAERAAVVVYGGIALAIELLLAAAARHASNHPQLLHEEEAPEEPSAARARGLASGALYGAAIVFAVLVLPKLAAFAYLAVAVGTVVFARGEGRLTLRSLGEG